VSLTGVLKERTVVHDACSDRAVARLEKSVSAMVKVKGEEREAHGGN